MELKSKYQSFGISIHTALSKFNKISDDRYKTLDVLHTLLRKNWVNEGFSSREEEKCFGLIGLDILTKYYTNPLDIGKRNIFIEKSIKKKLDSDIILYGVIDKCIVRKDNLIEIIDYKTSFEIPSIADLNEDMQLPLYTLLCKEALGEYPSILSYYYLSNNVKLSKQITHNDIEYFKQLVWDIYQKIKSEKNFNPALNSYCFKHCKYSILCSEQVIPSHFYPIIN